MTDVLAADYEALRAGTGAIVLPRDVIEVRGPDAASFLQGQLSQDLDGLNPGDDALSFLLQPQGKVDAVVRVVALGDGRFLVDVEGGWGEAVTGRLERFKLRVKAELEPLDWKCLAFRAPPPAPLAGAVLARPHWPVSQGVDVLDPDPAAPDWVRMCSLDAFEALRIENGMPAMGREVTEKTIPAETGLVAAAVSFTKGCFVGQELVARIDSRGGHVPRHLRGAVLDSADVPPAGATLHRDGREVGRITSAARSPRLGVVALAYVHRDVEPPCEVEVGGDGGPGGHGTARIEALPLA